MIEEIDGTSFDDKVRNSAKPVVVDFYGQQCQPCKKLLPILEQVSNEFGDQASFVKLDVGEAEEIAAQFGVLSVPTVLFFKEGEPVDKLVGLASRSTLQSRIADLVG